MLISERLYYPETSLGIEVMAIFQIRVALDHSAIAAALIQAR